MNPHFYTSLAGSARAELVALFFFFSKRSGHTSFKGDWGSDVGPSDLRRKRDPPPPPPPPRKTRAAGRGGDGAGARPVQKRKKKT